MCAIHCIFVHAGCCLLAAVRQGWIFWLCSCLCSSSRPETIPSQRWPTKQRSISYADSNRHRSRPQLRTDHGRLHGTVDIPNQYVASPSQMEHGMIRSSSHDRNNMSDSSEENCWRREPSNQPRSVERQGIGGKVERSKSPRTISHHKVGRSPQRGRSTRHTKPTKTKQLRHMGSSTPPNM